METEKTPLLQKKLLAAMAGRGLNGQKLARISRVSDSEISRILSGKSRPGLENAFRLARAVGISLDYLADEGLENEPPRATDSLSPEEREVLDLARAIGCARAGRILENIRIVGYEVAMRRLLDARPPQESAEAVRPQTPGASTSAAAVNPVAATRVGSL